MPSKMDQLYSSKSAHTPVGSTGSVSDRLRNFLIFTYGGTGSLNDLLTKNNQSKNQIQ